MWCLRLCLSACAREERGELSVAAQIDGGLPMHFDFVTVLQTQLSSSSSSNSSTGSSHLDNSNHLDTLADSLLKKIFAIVTSSSSFHNLAAANSNDSKSSSNPVQFELLQALLNLAFKLNPNMHKGLFYLLSDDTPVVLSSASNSGSSGNRGSGAARIPDDISLGTMDEDAVTMSQQQQPQQQPSSSQQPTSSQQSKSAATTLVRKSNKDDTKAALFYHTFAEQVCSSSCL